MSALIFKLFVAILWVTYVGTIYYIIYDYIYEGF